jgi:hypothetical protein
MLTIAYKGRYVVTKCQKPVYVICEGSPMFIVFPKCSRGYVYSRGYAYSRVLSSLTRQQESLTVLFNTDCLVIHGYLSKRAGGAIACLSNFG